jgi:hypothetical protein
MWARPLNHSKVINSFIAYSRADTAFFMTCREEVFSSGAIRYDSVINPVVFDTILSLDLVERIYYGGDSFICTVPQYCYRYKGYGLWSLYCIRTATIHYDRDEARIGIMLESIPELTTNYASIIELVTLVLFLLLIFFKRGIVFGKGQHPGNILFWYTFLFALYSSLFTYTLLRMVPEIIIAITVLLSLVIGAIVFICIGIIDTKTGRSPLMNFWERNKDNRVYAIFVMLFLLSIPFIATFAVESDIFHGTLWIKILLFVFFVAIAIAKKVKPKVG